jgi:hypothetical protein
MATVDLPQDEPPASLQITTPEPLPKQTEIMINQVTKSD